MSKKNREKRAAKAKARRAASAPSGGRVTPRARSGPGSGSRFGGAESATAFERNGPDPIPSDDRRTGDDRAHDPGSARGFGQGFGGRTTGGLGPSGGWRFGGAGQRRGDESVAELLDIAIAVLHDGGTLGRFVVVTELADRLDELVVVAAPLLRSLVVGMWDRGWQPSEAVRHVRRGCSATSVALMLAGVGADHVDRDPSTLDPRWTAQLDDLDLPDRAPSPSANADVDVESRLFDADRETENGGAAAHGAADRVSRGDGGGAARRVRAGHDSGSDDGRTARDPERWLRAWFAAEAAPRDAVVGLIELVVRLETAPPIEALIPPPGAAPGWRPKLDGSWGATDPSAPASARAEADPVLEKVRALLAKAESTQFEAEAEAFTAKAQELIARHAIDAALVAEARPDSDGPAAIRVCIDDPYVDAKALLLQLVAVAGRCRAVASTGIAMSTVVGFPGDLAAVELLFTSLLVQAQSALGAAARTAPPGARTRSRSYRSAFLLSYATRIGQRLEEVNAAVVAETEAEQGRSLLPVLASRQADVDGAVDDLFAGAFTTHRVRGGYDAAGWASGRLAADAAELNRAVAGSDG